MLKDDINQRVLAALGQALLNDPKLNKATLARSLECPPSKFSEILSGRMKAGVDLISRLVSIYGVSPTWLLTGDGDIFGREVTGSIPLIPMEAVAGYGAESYQDLPVEDYYTVGEFIHAEFLLRVKGDSMTPKYKSGDLVACRRIESISFWQWHAVYVICTRSQGVLIKRVEPGPDQDCVTCVSENPVYRPFQVPRDEIVAVASVLGAITLE